MFDFNDDERDQLFLNNANRDLSVCQRNINERRNTIEKKTEKREEGYGRTLPEEKVNGVVYRGYKRQFPTLEINKYKSGTHTSAEHGDRGVLPECVLDYIHQTRTSGSTYETEVLTFEVEYNDKRISCGVLEFCDENDFAYLPSWILSELGCTEGVQLTYRWVKLEPAQSLCLQPLSESYWGLKDVCVFMEEALRSYTTLNKGTTFTVPDPTVPGTCMHFKVLDTQPENAVQVINTDPIVDFDTSLCPKSPTIRRNSLKGGHMLCEITNNNNTDSDNSSSSNSDSDDVGSNNNYTVCELCGKSILNSNLRVHKLRCKQVSSSITKKKEIIIGKKFETTLCKYCGIAVAQDECEKHEEECGKRTVTCELCGKFVRRIDMDFHKETGCAYTHSFFDNLRFYTCDGCGKTFGDESHLLVHSKECYGKEIGVIEENIFVCPVCQVPFIDELEYLEHVSLCLNDGGDDEENGYHNGEMKGNSNYGMLAERKHVCHICGKKFRKQNKLKDHMHKVHH